MSQSDQQLERAVQFLNPVSGEVLTLAARSDDLGRYLADIREFESVLREHKKLVSRELLNRMDQQVTYTHHFPGGLTVKGQSPQPVEEWDGATLRQALLPFVDEGVLAIEAVDAAVSVEIPEPVYKSNKGAIKKLRKLGGRVAEVVNSLAVEHEKDRYITVSRNG